MVRDWFKRGAAALGGFALLAAAPAAQPAATAPHGHPAMWKLADKDTTIYLFGTFHLLPQGRDWRTPTFDKALASSDELVMEIGNIDDTNAVAQAMLKLGMKPGLSPIAERVPPEKKAALKAMITDSGVPEQVLDSMKTWAAALMLSGVTYQRLHLDPNAGVERTLETPWKQSGKPVEGLETAEQQFGFFDHLSEEAQRAFLVAVLESPQDLQKEFQAMLQAWMNGDVDGIARTFDDETQLSPELRKTLMADRNAHWADWLKARLEKPGTVFVAVGAGHLAGKDSVENILAAKGLKVTRVQ
jgi:uncharacterized protein YbaP (TraB family)